MNELHTVTGVAIAGADNSLTAYYVFSGLQEKKNPKRYLLTSAAVM